MYKEFFQQTIEKIESLFDEVEIRMDLGYLDGTEESYNDSRYECLSQLQNLQILRRYLFVASYQSFERQLIHDCKFIENIYSETKRDLILYKEIYGRNCVEKCKIYMTKIAKITIQSENLWQTISNYNLLRNCIVHSEATIDPKQRGDPLRKFVEAHEYLVLADKDDDIFFKGEILFKEGFCEETLINFDAFLDELGDQIKTKFGHYPGVVK